MFFISFCSFFKCHANQRGGAICVFGIDKIIINKNCILNCSSSFTSPGLMLWGNNGIINQIDFNNSDYNNSDYNNPHPTTHSSFLLSFKLKMNNINISNTVSTQYCSGIFFGSAQSCNMSSFCQISNCKGASFMGFTVINNNLVLNFIILILLIILLVHLGF